MTATEERKLVLTMLTKLQKSVDRLEESMKSGGVAMKGLSRELNKLKREGLEVQVQDNVVTNKSESQTKKKPKSKSKTLDLENRGANLFDPNDYAQSTESDKNYDNVDDTVVASRTKTRPGFKKKNVFCEDCNKNVLVHPNVRLSEQEDTKVKVYNCPESKAPGGCPNQ